jgi:hypothetical protein
MKIFLFTLFFVFSISTEVYAQASHSTDAKKPELSYEQVVSRLQEVEASSKAEEKIDLLINLLSLFSTVILAVFFGIGGFLAWNSYLIRNEAKDELRSIERLKDESTKIYDSIVVGYGNYESTLKTHEKTAEELINNLKKLSGKATKEDSETVKKKEIDKLVSEYAKRISEIRSKKIEILIPKGTSRSLLEQLGKLLKANLGENPVIVLLPNGKSKRRMVLPYKVKWSNNLGAQVDEILETRQFT